MNKKNRTPAILLIILLALFAFHFSQYQFKWIKLKPLSGYYIDSNKVKFTWNDWLSGTYQESQDKYLNDHVGFRNFFIRLNHQLRFSLFNIAKAQRVIVGKENYLYEESYIIAYYGDDFIGEDNIEQRLYKLKMLQDTLNNMEKKIIAVLAPGKGSFFPEYIPDSYHKERTTTNIEVYRKYIEEYNINCIDFHQYFIDNKYTSPYPLYPQYDVHWSYYGQCLALDSMIRYVEQLKNIEMPHVYWENMRIGQPPKDYDCGIAQAMNLLFRPRTFDLAYPVLQCESDEGKTKPSLLVVSDSFYWGMYNMGMEYYFANDHFWYYNKEIYPENFYNPFTTEEVNLHEEILKYDVIIILGTDANLPGFGWGFIENAYEIFYPSESDSINLSTFANKL